MQILNETSVAGWVNYMRDNMTAGVGQFIAATATPVPGMNRRDLQRDWSAEIALADNPAALVNSLATRLLGGPAPGPLHAELVNAVTSLSVPVSLGPSNITAVNAAKRVRVNAAVLLIMATPEFLVQK